MVSDPHNICLYTSFGIFAEKKSECSFFQKISPKSKIPFFSKNFSRIFQISRKLLNIFSSLFLVPLDDILRHLLKKKIKKKSNFIFVKKFRNFFFLRKNFGRKKEFLKFLERYSIFFLIILGPLRRLIKTCFNKKVKKKIEFYFCQKISQLFF